MRLSALLLPLLLLGCARADGPWVEIHGHRFSVEVADTPDKRALGLMYRRELADDHGMWFVFEREQPLSFWMKNTRIPLDMLFFDQQMRLVKLHENVPPCRRIRCPSYASGRPARYVLEINAGLSRKLGIREGQQATVRLEP